ncbi:SBBP repeat-containing protein [Nostoc sphaeroides]|uniref:Outer membrane protein assembly factor BamB, containings PQQ beta-propeller repeat n=1 Tax=Nostoc sphaeroides CCNUC1 TaxID=2653204 RepID=A0A5P8WCR1_9NOSO|nr:SBBP repeat-containing protein [Nostoc sphaeroides]QFS50414.1 Outer membrane protein assembly factor BamB, containings PQQ beta-propeller repeat [Nostoc sphaeroides CCNUC1]
MANNQLGISLLTPASDLVLAAGTTDSEALFARAGNDTIYPDNPVVSATQATNVDYLFGDIFDNSPEEYEIILNIQAAQQGGNPFLILDRNIPSVGADRFVLGDRTQPYYTTSNPATLLTTNFLGLNEYAVIYDFGVNNDIIQLNGRPQDYRIVKITGLQVAGIAQPLSGLAIFSVQQVLPDLVAFVVAKPEVNLDLNSNNFRFIGQKPLIKPTSYRKIAQLATTGNDLSLAVNTDSAGNIYLGGTTTGTLFGTNQGLGDAWVEKYNANGTLVWGRQFGSSGDESNFASVTDSNGNTYLAGGTSGNLFGTKQTETDVWVAKYDTNGNRVWGRQFTAGGFSSGAFSIDLDPAGNVYLSGIAIKNNTRTDIFNFAVQDDSWVSKFDTNGNQQWTTLIKNPSATFPFDITPFFDESYDLAVDNNGNSIAVGWTQGLVTESDPSRQLLKYDAWVSKVNTAGQVQWVQQLGSINQGLDFAWGVDTDSQGNIYVTGWTTGAIGANPGQTGIGGRDIWITKLTPNGTQVWAKQIGSPDDDGMFLSDMQIDQNDNIFIIGHTNGLLGNGTNDPSYNVWVAKFDTNGNNNWVQQFGRQNNLDYPTGVTTDGTGRLYVTGFTDSSLTNPTGVTSSAVDGWLAQLDANSGSLQKFIGRSINGLSLSTDVPSGSTDVLTGSTDVPSGSTDVLTGSTDVPSGSTDVLTGSTDVLTGSTDVLTGSTDVLTGSTDVLTGSTDVLTGSTDILTGSTDSISSASDVFSIAVPAPIRTIDITNSLVTSEKLPQGDNRINPAEGINLNFGQRITTPSTSSTFNYGQFVSSLDSIFDSGLQPAFSSSLTQAVNNGSLVI